LLELPFSLARLPPSLYWIANPPKQFRFDVHQSLHTVATDLHDVVYASARNNPRNPID
jgi:hypothetical protein